MFNVVYAFKRESFMHIVDCAQLHEKGKIGFFSIFVCHLSIYDLFLSKSMIYFSLEYYYLIFHGTDVLLQSLTRVSRR